MKIAVLSDIHGNVPALEAVLENIERWSPDELIVNGDLISRGPCSLECLRMLQATFPRCRFLKGNHEAFVLTCAQSPPAPTDSARDLSRFARWTAAKLGDALSEVGSWDDHVDLPAAERGASVHVTHGSRLGNRDGILPENEDQELGAKLGDAPGLFVGSHTHRPLIRRFSGTLVVNTGSVGQPFDQDARAAYGRFTFRAGKWYAAITRVEYDKARAERDFIESGFLDEGGPLARLIFLEHRHNRMLVGRMMKCYHDRIKAGEIAAEDAVDKFLSALEIDL